MFDDLIEKIVAMLPEQIREKLPERFRSEKLGDDDKTGDVKIDIGEATQVDAGNDDDEDSDDESSEDSDDDDDDEEEDEDDAKAKKRSRLIKIFVIGAIVWFVLDMMDEQPQAPKDGKKKSKALAKKKKAKKSKKKPQKEAIEAPAKKKEEIPAIEEPKIVKKEEAPIVILDPPKEEVAPIEIPEPVIKEPVAEKVEAAPEIKTPDIPDVELPDSTLVFPEEFKPEKLGESSEPKVDDNQLDKLFAEEQQSETKDAMERPDFERVGAGLVYNCKGKHWACLDRKNYFLCRDLELAVGDGSPECAIVETYSSVKDCQIMQVYKVNRANPPKACKFED